MSNNESDRKLVGLNLTRGQIIMQTTPTTSWINLSTDYHPDADMVYDLQSGRLPMWADNHFDIVHCHYVLEYSPNYDVLLRELCRLLKPNGNLSLMTTHADCRYAGSDPQMQIRFLPEMFLDYQSQPGSRLKGYDWRPVWIEVQRWPTAADRHQPGDHFTSIFVNFRKNGPMFQWEQDLSGEAAHV